MKRRLFKIIERPTADDFPSRVFVVFIMTLIVFNVMAVILETVEEIARPLARVFALFEDFSVAVFTAEYVLRLWACVSEAKYRHPVRGRLRYALTPLALVDLLAIVPFYLEFLPVDLRFVRVLRLFRLFRIFKLARYSASMRTLDDVIRAKKEELLVTLFVVVILLIFASSTMYYAENEAQPDKFSSIPSAMWWGVATLTTVGYGDVFPVTPVGRLLGAVIAVLGVGLFALPTGILASGFSEELQKSRQRERAVCPHCGRDLHARPGDEEQTPGERPPEAPASEE
ncbi:MAG TPA: ion transporter [Pyrinomonadaceae bacterium]|nr:ion transporter [Pyrinomonadaceae bacterium]